MKTAYLVFRIVIIIIIIIWLFVLANVGYGQDFKIDNLTLPNKIGMEFLTYCAANPDTIDHSTWKWFLRDPDSYPDLKNRITVGYSGWQKGKRQTLLQRKPNVYNLLLWLDKRKKGKK